MAPTEHDQCKNPFALFILNFKEQMVLIKITKKVVTVMANIEIGRLKKMEGNKKNNKESA